MNWAILHLSYNISISKYQTAGGAIMSQHNTTITEKVLHVLFLSYGRTCRLQV